MKEINPKFVEVVELSFADYDYLVRRAEQADELEKQRDEYFDIAWKQAMEGPGNLLRACFAGAALATDDPEFASTALGFIEVTTPDAPA